MDTLTKFLASTHANAVSELIAKERVNHCDFFGCSNISSKASSRNVSAFNYFFLQ